MTRQVALVKRWKMDPRYTRFNQYVGIMSRETTGRSLCTAWKRVHEEAHLAGEREIAFVEITLESFNLSFERVLT